jgi:mono/diheme cytochrome c family protein
MRGVIARVVAVVSLSASGASAQDSAVLKRGNDAYQYWCATCHGRGPGNPGTTALSAKYKKALPGVLEDRTDLTTQAIRFYVRRGTSIMPFFRKTEVSDADLEAIALYLTTRSPARSSQSQKP